MPKTHIRGRSLGLPASRTARVLLLAAAALIVLTVGALARSPHEDSRAATPDATATHRATSTPAASATASQLPSGDPEGNEGAVAAVVHREGIAAGELNGGRFSMPLKGWTKVTDRYGAPRGGGLVHGGIDLALSDGYHSSAVYSACAGTVWYTGYSGVYGNHVIVDCGDGFQTLYGHMSSIRVTQGQAVDNTVVVGISGTTGFSTGEHLHFEIRVDDAPVNPENYLDFHIAPGTPLSDGPIVFPGAGGGSATSTPTAAASEPSATATATATPTATSTMTPTPTATPTATPTPKAPKKTPTLPIAR